MSLFQLCFAFLLAGTIYILVDGENTFIGKTKFKVMTRFTSEAWNAQISCEPKPKVANMSFLQARTSSRACLKMIRQTRRTSRSSSSPLSSSLFSHSSPALVAVEQPTSLAACLEGDNREIDSIAISIFVDILVELTNTVFVNSTNRSLSLAACLEGDNRQGASLSVMVFGSYHLLLNQSFSKSEAAMLSGDNGKQMCWNDSQVKNSFPNNP